MLPKKKLGIPNLVDASDLVETPNNLVNMTYLSYYREKYLQRLEEEEEKAADPQQQIVIPESFTKQAEEPPPLVQEQKLSSSDIGISGKRSTPQEKKKEKAQSRKTMAIPSAPKSGKKPTPEKPMDNIPEDDRQNLELRGRSKSSVGTSEVISPKASRKTTVQKSDEKSDIRSSEKKTTYPEIQ